MFSRQAQHSISNLNGAIFVYRVRPLSETPARLPDAAAPPIACRHRRWRCCRAHALSSHCRRAHSSAPFHRRVSSLPRCTPSTHATAMQSPSPVMVGPPPLLKRTATPRCSPTRVPKAPKAREAPSNAPKASPQSPQAQIAPARPPRPPPALFDALLWRAERSALRRARGVRADLTPLERASRAREAHLRSFEHAVVLGGLSIRYNFTVPCVESALAARQRRSRRASTDPPATKRARRDHCASLEPAPPLGVLEAARLAYAQRRSERSSPDTAPTPPCDSTPSPPPCASSSPPPSCVSSSPPPPATTPQRKPEPPRRETDPRTYRTRVGGPPGARARPIGDMLRDVGERNAAAKRLLAANRLSVDSVDGGDVDYRFDGQAEEGFVCASCGARARDMRSMRAHLWAAHHIAPQRVRAWQPAFMCVPGVRRKCGAVFGTLDELNTHARTIHGADCPVVVDVSQCEHCGLRLPCRDALVRHVASHRADGYLQDVNVKRVAEGLAPWSRSGATGGDKGGSRVN